MFYGNGRFVVPETVISDDGIKTVSAPYTVFAFEDPVARDCIPAESKFYPVCGCIGKIVFQQQVIIAAATAGFHG